jgi:hypothetical protein
MQQGKQDRHKVSKIVCLTLFRVQQVMRSALKIACVMCAALLCCYGSLRQAAVTAVNMC